MVILILFFTAVFANHASETIFTLNSKSWTSVDFYEDVFFDDWVGFDTSQKKSIFNDFLKKELSYIASKEEGLNLHPLIQKKLLSKKKQVMINNVYEHLISRPQISKKILNTHLQNLQYKSQAHHLLIGFNGSIQNTGSLISKDSAFVQINSLYNKLLDVPKDSVVYFFETAAFDNSVDPSAKQNKGLLGWVPWGRTVMSFQQPLFELNINTISSPILTEYGYHLILKTDEDFSSYHYFSKEKYNDLAYKVGQSSLSFDSLRVFASEFDSTLISRAGVTFNNLMLDSLFLIIENKQKESRLLGNKSSLIKWLKDFNSTKTTLLVYNNKGVGLGWLINQIESISSTRIPQITNTSVLKELILSFILQELVVSVGYKNKIDTTSSFKREFLDVEKNILLNEYISNLLNNIPKIDSTEVKSKYDSGVYNGEYAQPQQAIFSEIRHNKKDSLENILNLLQAGEDFNQLLKRFGGDIKQPITYKRGSALSQAVFNLNINEISGIIENNNGSYSVVRLEKILDPVYFGFKDVYSQIERKIIKEKQDYIKDNVLTLLKEKYKININEKWLNF